MKRQASLKIAKFASAVDLTDLEVWAELELRRRCEMAAKDARIRALCEASRHDPEFESPPRCE